MKLRKERVALPDAKGARTDANATMYRVEQHWGDEICAGVLYFTDEMIQNCVLSRKMIAESLAELRANIRSAVSIKEAGW